MGSGGLGLVLTETIVGSVPSVSGPVEGSSAHQPAFWVSMESTASTQSTKRVVWQVRME